MVTSLRESTRVTTEKFSRPKRSKVTWVTRYPSVQKLSEGRGNGISKRRSGWWVVVSWLEIVKILISFKRLRGFKCSGKQLYPLPTAHRSGEPNFVVGRPSNRVKGKWNEKKYSSQKPVFFVNNMYIISSAVPINKNINNGVNQKNSHDTSSIKLYG